jgi:hypothetical protein
VPLIYIVLLFDLQAGKLIANLIVMGSGIIGRAMLQAYRKALDSKFFHPLQSVYRGYLFVP